MKYLSFTLILLLIGTVFSCKKEYTETNDTPTVVTPRVPLQKFEPADGENILLIGQSDTVQMKAYLNAANNTPAGFMFYMSLIGNIGENLTEIKNFSKQYPNTVLQIGIWTGKGDENNNVEELNKIAAGTRDVNIRYFASWCKELNIPIFLRFGYEFDGKHNEYSPTEYVPAYTHFVDLMREENVDNVAYVWHSYNAPPYNGHSIEEWYPGDDYVDWVGLSVFGQGYGSVTSGDAVMNFAKDHDKPIMLAETASINTEYITVDPITMDIWYAWFTKVLNFCDNHDEVKMLCYINVDWDSDWGDTRIENDAEVLDLWLTNTESYAHSSEELYTSLGFVK